MPFGDIGFSGYWDAAANKIIGRANIGLFTAARQEVQLYKVVVAGDTQLNGVGGWQVGDFAYHNGFEWSKLLGPAGVASSLASYFANLPTQPPVGGPGLWLDGNVLVFS